MMLHARRGLILGLLAGLAVLPACVSRDDASSSDDSIVGGVAAKDYPEGALVDFQIDGSSSICSGAVIAPKVVLTAGHCVAGASSWFVRAGGMSASASTAAVLDYPAGWKNLDTSTHDVGLVFLDEAITLARYPEIANVPLPDGARVANVGRILDGVQMSSLFQGESVVRDGAPYSAPFDYTSSIVIQPGDSGGPDFAVGTHTIHAVNSGRSDGLGVEFLARVDLVHDWIMQQISAHGGMAGTDTTGPIPLAQLQSVDHYEIVAQQLNCRAGAGVAQPIVTTLFQGQQLEVATSDSVPRVATAPDGKPWLFVKAPFLPGTSCFVSAGFQFIQPRPDTTTPPALPALVVRPGLFGSLALAVHDGAVTGSIHEGACELTVAGTIPEQNPIELALLTPGSAKRARLQVIDDQSVLFSTSDLPGTCAGIFDPVQLVSGIRLAFRASISDAVTAFRTIQSTRAYFHDAPGMPQSSVFVIRGQTVQQLSENVGGFVQVRYSPEHGAPTTGYLSTSDLVALGVGANL